ncbi:hypothetical protein PISMIDRAFT_346805 [Pisolithus microcarpus 441]|uniref:Uncharacterized protein n=1 Tax=Pisolithus microcarpus 441 TaxID=765257 RepID=A0A0C9YD81_9AGAM|nr:hypothetical protein PISMIDRAFT_346805 [Pisolithus microcarpus 441]
MKRACEKVLRKVMSLHSRPTIGVSQFSPPSQPSLPHMQFSPCPKASWARPRHALLLTRQGIHRSRRAGSRLPVQQL